MSKTSHPKVEDIKRSWKMIDATGKSLGRLAGSAAKILMGKDKAHFSPNILCGDFVIIINSDKIRLTGKKWIQKTYYKHSRFVGSLKERKARDISSPELIKKAVAGMLPKNKHRPRNLKRLKIFKDAQHSYQQQTIEEVKL